ncbi:MAG: hypothetical protein HYW48_05960 [Deltaproteobacteria bacterium]|nr:hypothetical protein [Deltaproteobacteria bacterium]
MKNWRNLLLVVLNIFFLPFLLEGCFPQQAQKRSKIDFKGEIKKGDSQVTLFMAFRSPEDNRNFFQHYIAAAPLLKTKQDTYKLNLAVINIKADVSPSVLKSHLVRDLNDEMKGKNYTFEPEKAVFFDPIHRYDPWDAPLALISKEKEAFKKLNALINETVMKIEHAAMAGEYIPDQFQPHIIVASRSFLNEHTGVLSKEQSLGIRDQILQALNQRIEKSSQSYPLILMTE